jgi:hypothetical protein
LDTQKNSLSAPRLFLRPRTRGTGRSDSVENLRSERKTLGCSGHPRRVLNNETIPYCLSNESPGVIGGSRSEGFHSDLQASRLVAFVPKHPMAVQNRSRIWRECPNPPRAHSSSQRWFRSPG